MTNKDIKNIAYIPRGKCNTRNVTDEMLMQKRLFQDFHCVTLDPNILPRESLIRILSELDILIFPSGAAGLFCIHCRKECIVIELSPQTVLFPEVENQDYITRTGRHYVYICDEQGGVVGDGEPCEMTLDYDRLRRFIIDRCL
jgi:hypothetical protein